MDVILIGCNNETKRWAPFQTAIVQTGMLLWFPLRDFQHKLYSIFARNNWACLPKVIGANILVEPIQRIRARIRPFELKIIVKFIL